MISLASELTDAKGRRARAGWVFFDADCAFCTSMARRFRPLLGSHGFGLAPLQSPRVRDLLDLPEEELLREMRLLTPSGAVLGGADSILHVAEQIWWARPLAALGRIPRVHDWLERGYRWFAARRNCISGSCAHRQVAAWPGWLPLILLPALAILLRGAMPPWAFMWLLAFTVFLGCKWQTWWQLRVEGFRPRVARSLAYLLAWPGMDARTFCDESSRPSVPRTKEWLVAWAKAVLGALLIWQVAPQTSSALVAGWVGMLGLVLLLHFGTFCLLALFWRRVGLNARPIMNAPLQSRSLSEFWGRRWNLGFRQLTHRLVFEPLLHRAGVGVATFGAFLASGLIHDLVISLPAGAGYGLPTAYFAVQGAGVLAERSKLGRRLHLDRGLSGWLFLAVMTIGPAYWLFHPWFVERVMVPFLSVVGAL